MNRKIFIAAALIASAGFAQAASQSFETPDGVQIILHDTECSPTILNVIKEEFHDQFKRSVVNVAGVRVESCWTGPDADNDLILINENGQGMAVPVGSMKKIPNA